jgi:hypothetical protein
MKSIKATVMLLYISTVLGGCVDPELDGVAEPTSDGTSADLDSKSLTASPAVSAVASYTNFITNAWSGGLGVIHVKDGTYTHGTYDALLPPNNNTVDAFGWSTTAGWYAGPGYCTSQLRSDDRGNTWYWQLPDLGSGQHFIGANTSYVVFPYRC